MKNAKIQTALRISLFSAVIAVSAMISVPFPIPFTLQIFGIFLALMTLGGSAGTVAVILYVFLGILGIPVFSGFGAGIGYLFGAGGGFIIAFVIAALIFWIFEIVFGRGKYKKLIYSLILLLPIYVIGSLWFAFVYSTKEGFLAAFTVAALPFIIPDVIKILLAFYISDRLRKIIKLN